IILFSKGCSSPSITLTASPPSPLLPLRPAPLPRVASPRALPLYGLVASGRQPLQAALLPTSVAPAGCCTCGRSPTGYWRLSSLAGATGLPCGLALAAVGRPLADGQAMAGRGKPPSFLVVFAAKM
ncbi:hypothetical protein BHM03_00050836, partial [Ensete ventricosum]